MDCLKVGKSKAKAVDSLRKVNFPVRMGPWLGWLAGWEFCWLAGWLAGWLADKIVGIYWIPLRESSGFLKSRGK